MDSSSEEDGSAKSSTNNNDYFVAGVENMVVYGQFKEDQHVVLLVVQESDGAEPGQQPMEFDQPTDDDDYNNDGHNVVRTTQASVEADSNEPFPDIFVRYDSKEGPSPDDLMEMRTMYNDFIRGLKI